MPEMQEEILEISPLQSSPKTLVELTSLKIALRIWLEVFPSSVHGSPIVRKSLLRAPLNRLTANLPNKMRKLITSHFRVIFKEMCRWIKNSMNILLSFKQNYYSFISEHLHLVIFGGNGVINLKDTIMNYIENVSAIEKDFSSNIPVMKFELACIYCIEEKIDFYWPSVSSSFRLDSMQPNDNVMLYYWVCRKRGELPRIPDIDEYDADSIESFMIFECNRRTNGLAIEYFLKLLSPEDRFSAVDFLLEHGYCYPFRRHMLSLPYFDPPLQRYILDKKSTDILIFFIVDCEMIEYAIQCWLYVRNFITPEKFYDDVISIFIRWSKDRGERDGVYLYTYLKDVLLEIWFHTPRHLKEYIVNIHFSNIANELSTCRHRDYFLKNSRRDIEFLLKLLSDAEFPLRYNFWNEHWSEWFEGVPPSQFERLMELCLEKPEDIEDFKKTFTNTDVFQKYCGRLIREGCHYELNAFLGIFNLNPDRVLNIKKHSVMDGYGIIFLKYSGQDGFPKELELFKKHAQYIDNMFSNNILANDFKDQWILSDEVVTLLYRRFFRVPEIESIISLFVSVKKLPELKIKLLQICHDRITNGNPVSFGGPKLRDFLMWCLDNNEELFDNFMKSLPIYVIFEADFLNWLKYFSVYSYRIRPFREWKELFLKEDFGTSDLNTFFKTYFESDDGLYGNFKRERFEYYEAMCEAEVERIFGHDKESIIYVMKACLL